MDLKEYLDSKNLDQGLKALILDLAVVSLKIANGIHSLIPVNLQSKNVFGEEQKGADILADDLICEALKKSHNVLSFCGEESKELQWNDLNDSNSSDLRKYSVFFDPLDGSSLSDTNFSIGTIFGIYEGAIFEKNGVSLKKSAREMVASIYFIYGPRLTLVISFGSGVAEFQFDSGIWTLITDNLRLREVNGDALPVSRYFAPGNLRACIENSVYESIVLEYIKDACTLRYSGGMVPDINHILKKGAGVFLYPGTLKNPNGKLRLLYDCGPLAFIIEQAGGMSSDGDTSILDIVIESLNQTSPIYLGEVFEIKKIEAALSQ